MSLIFGPVPSRRFGLSLGIDLSPEHKACNFDCLYCELEPAKPVDHIPNPPSVKQVITQVQEALERFLDVEMITITANGEPTLYPHLDELIDELNKIKQDKKLLILSNASRIHEPQIQKVLAKLDIVKLSLDCATPRCFKRLDRPLKNISLEKIIQGIEQFRKLYKGLLVIEILVVKGINDKQEEFTALGQMLRRIQPDRVDVGTIDRPPAYNVEPVSYERLFELSHELRGLPVTIVSRHFGQNYFTNLSKEEILDLLAHRPLTQEDITHLFDKPSQQRLQELFQDNKIEKITVGTIDFFKTT